MRTIVAGVHALDSVLRVCTYHLVRYLAGEPDSRVLYLPSPISPLHFLLRRGDARFVERRPFWGSRPAQWIENAWQFTPLSLRPVSKRFSPNSAEPVRRMIRAAFPPLAPLLRKSGFDKPDVLIVTNLQYAFLDQIVKPKRLVYRCEDDIRGFASAPGALARAEEDLLRRCDLCFATSHNLAEKLKARGARSVHVTRHGVDPAPFDAPSAQIEPDDLRAIRHPRVVYVGAFSDWFDAQWVAAAARELPGHQFVLIGPRETSSNLSLPQAPNVHLLGPRPPETIPAYLHACDVAIIPFRLSPLVESVLPMKLYEYLAAGLPVVATRWRELELTGAPMRLATTEREFIDAIRQASTDPSRAERLAFAHAHTWGKQFAEMSEIVAGKSKAPLADRQHRGA